ncbi:hypothetical protein E5288_WYG007699 [Bos mutus]|uniref:Uncharacterized protein n=1 Tax=Bos mutus TaxID=72004 RepID=A0A6B0RGA9_9CETA|nr:hypothetical protein [Bos mutus]
MRKTLVITFLEINEKWLAKRGKDQTTPQSSLCRQCWKPENTKTTPRNALAVHPLSDPEHVNPLMGGAVLAVKPLFGDQDGDRRHSPPTTGRGEPSAAPRSHSGSQASRRRELTEQMVWSTVVTAPPEQGTGDLEATTHLKVWNAAAQSDYVCMDL